MKANELMVGDWYLASKSHSTMEGDYSLEFYPKKLTIDDLIYAKDNDWDEVDWAEFTKLIPLTTEILNKNGFGYIKVDKYATLDLTHFYLGEPHFIKDSNLHIGTNNKGDFWVNTHWNTIYGIKYVHEFQRALRCCDFWDLADSIII